MIFLNIIDFLRDVYHHPEQLFNVEALIRYGGLIILFLVVFCQTGFFFCFFLPGDALLFTAGVLTAGGTFHHRIEILCLDITTAALLGNLCGYWIGHSTGPLFYKRKDSWFFRKEQLVLADRFFRKYGALAITVGFFLPIIRTFAPLVCGIIRYSFTRFVISSTLGAFLWINLMIVPGYLLGNVPFVRNNLEFIVLGMIILITTPVILKFMRELIRLRARGKIPVNNDEIF